MSREIEREKERERQRDREEERDVHTENARERARERERKTPRDNSFGQRERDTESVRICHDSQPVKDERGQEREWRTRSGKPAVLYTYRERAREFVYV